MNIKYRKKIIEEYFKCEKDTYWWIHLTESDAIDLEKENNQQLLENTYYEFEDLNGKKMREYHVNTHATFRDETKYWKKLSIQWNPSTMPIMIVGQDKSVFKQYLFGHKCWVGPGGETHLLPKSDGYSKMVSGFVSRDFGVGLHLGESEI